MVSFLSAKRNTYNKAILDEIAVACVTVWVQHN